MPKKYSSYDKNQLLCEAFRKFVLEEGKWGEDPCLNDKPSKINDSGPRRGKVIRGKAIRGKANKNKKIRERKS